VEYAYRAEGWQAFFGAVAAASAALAGLLFIALSLNIRAMAKDATFLARAREAFGGFLCLLVLALVTLIPGQDRHVLGAELVALALVIAGFSVVLQGSTVRNLPREHRGRWVIRLLPLNLATAAILVAGVSMCIARYGGLFWLVPTVIVYFVWAFFTIWSLIVQIAEV
jgi:modulator of FtsH protease